jgi:hypothetical protein
MSRSWPGPGPDDQDGRRHRARASQRQRLLVIGGLVLAGAVIGLVAVLALVSVR